MSQSVSTVEQLYQALLKTRTADPRSMRDREQELQAILRENGVLLKLQTIAITPSLDINVRQLAIIQAKNLVTTQWRSKIKNPEADQAIMRTNILQMVGEPDDIIAHNNETMAARVARIDYPRIWPNLLTQLVEIIGAHAGSITSPTLNESSLRLKRALRLMNVILKEFGTMRSPLGTKVNTQAVAETHNFISNLAQQMSKHVESTLNPGNVGDPAMLYAIEISHLSWKCWSKVVLWVWNKQKTQEEEQAFNNFFAFTINQLQGLWSFRTALAEALYLKQIPASDVTIKTLELITRRVKAFGKGFRRMQQTGIVRFVTLPGCSQLVLYYWDRVMEATNALPEYTADSPHAVYPVQLLVQCLAIFKDSLAQWSPSRKASGTQLDPNNETLPLEFVTNAVSMLITRLLPLKAADLKKWEDDPEDWVNTEEKDNEAWEYDLRACSERVLVTLAHQYPDYITPLLQQLFVTVVLVPPTDLNGILSREAVYCALGRCSARLRDAVSYEQWLPILDSESQEINPQYRIVKRRIAWLIGRWHYEKPGPAATSKIWEILRRLLTDPSAGTDSVVRFTAAAAVKDCVDTLDFNLELFEPFLGDFVRALMTLVHQSDTTENKRRVVDSLTVVLKRSKQKVAPFLPEILGPFPAMWTEADNDYLLKGSLIHLISVAVESSAEHSNQLLPLAIPLIKESLSPLAKAQLEGDGLILWATALKEAVSLSTATSPNLVELLPQAIHMLENDLDVLGHVTWILESYYILDADSILQLCAPQLFTAYAAALKQAVNTNQKDLLESIALLIQLSSSSLSWAGPMHTSGLFAQIVKHLTDGRGSSIVLVEDLSVFSRMLLQDPTVFDQLVVETAKTKAISVEEQYDKLLDQWWRQFDSIAEPHLRKLSAMGLANLATIGRPEVVKRLSNEIANTWLDVLGEMKEALSEDTEHYSSHLHMYWSQNGGEPPESFMRDSFESLEESRRKTLWQKDPVQTVKLTSFIDEKLKAIGAAIGPEAFQKEFMEKADPAVIKQLKEALSQ
ncbi:hypothetical protein FRC02_009496 [Tulasnella sp. 418]|nr:hypothetical protein FRC02_009496 [Tulasnella sp. 418]